MSMFGLMWNAITGVAGRFGISAKALVLGTVFLLGLGVAFFATKSYYESSIAEIADAAKSERERLEAANLRLTQDVEQLRITLDDERRLIKFLREEQKATDDQVTKLVEERQRLQSVAGDLAREKAALIAAKRKGTDDEKRFAACADLRVPDDIVRLWFIAAGTDATATGGVQGPAGALTAPGAIFEALPTAGGSDAAVRHDARRHDDGIPDSTAGIASVQRATARDSDSRTAPHEVGE